MRELLLIDDVGGHNKTGLSLDLRFHFQLVNGEGRHVFLAAIDGIFLTFDESKMSYHREPCPSAALRDSKNLIYPSYGILRKKLLGGKRMELTEEVKALLLNTAKSLLEKVHPIGLRSQMTFLQMSAFQTAS